MLFFAFLIAIGLAVTLAFESEKIGSRKEEIMMPMRDGVKLHTLAFLPRGAGADKKVPAVVDRSPYGYHDMEWITDIFLPFGFAGMIIYHDSILCSFLQSILTPIFYSFSCSCRSRYARH